MRSRLPLSHRLPLVERWSNPSITSIGPCQLSNKREKDHCSRYTTGATELGSCLTDVTREGSLPKSRSCVTAMLWPERVTQQSSRPLDPVESLDLRVTKAAIKFWTKIGRCQVS